MWHILDSQGRILAVAFMNEIETFQAATFSLGSGWGLELMVQILGFRVKILRRSLGAHSLYVPSGSGIRVWVLGYGVWVLGTWINCHREIEVSGCPSLDLGFGSLSVGFQVWVQDIRLRSKTQCSGFGGG